MNAQKLLTEQEVLRLAAKLANALPATALIFLLGDLGAGKTTLVRGMLQALGYQDLVTSPTFTLVETYDIADRTIHHFDLYRITDPVELEYIGMDDYLVSSICLIEWAHNGGAKLGEPDLVIELSICDDKRLVKLQPITTVGHDIVAKVTNCNHLNLR